MPLADHGCTNLVIFCATANTVAGTLHGNTAWEISHNREKGYVAEGSHEQTLEMKNANGMGKGNEASSDTVGDDHIRTHGKTGAAGRNASTVKRISVAGRIVLRSGPNGWNASVGADPCDRNREKSA